MALKFIPASNKIVVQSHKMQEKKQSLIVTAPMYEKTSPICEVVAVHEGYLDANNHLRQPLFKVGDLVRLGTYGAEEIDIGGKNYIIVPETEILGKYVEEEIEELSADNLPHGH